MPDSNEPPRRRLTLMEAYGSFSDDHLKDLACKIKQIGKEVKLGKNINKKNRQITSKSVDESLDVTVDQPADLQVTVPVADQVGEVPRVDDQVTVQVADQIAVQVADQAGDPIYHSVVEPLDESSSVSPVLLTENQALLYFCLQIINGNVTSLNRISQEIHVSVYTLKSCLQKLRQENLIHYGGLCNCGGRIGFTARPVWRPIILRGDKNKLLSKLKAINCRNLMFVVPLGQDPQTDPVKLLHDQIVDSLLDHPVEAHYSSSSSLFKKTTTTKVGNHKDTSTRTEAIAKALATHPELGYWRQKGLTARQVEQWLDLTGASLESMLQSLCHCRFEMVDMDLERLKNVNNVFNWFYRVIERIGYYPTPKGYKSFQEKQLEIEQKLLAEKQERLKALEEIQRQKREVERELTFREMLADPASELYQECFKRLNNYAKQTRLSSIFERAMREAFHQVMDEREAQLFQEMAAREEENSKGPSRPRK